MRIIFKTLSALVAITNIAACSTAQSEPAPTPVVPVIQAPAPAPTPPPVAAPIIPKGEWIDWPLSQGTWVYRQDDRGSIALFGAPNSDALLTIRCDHNQRQIFISRVGTSQPATGTMTLRASSGLETYMARPTGGETPYTAIAVMTNDIMLDRIAFSRGRFAVETSGLDSVAIPIWPEFTRVVEDCRS